MAVQRIISKQLGGVEDLLLDASGEPTVTQQRASGSKIITKLHSGTIPHKKVDGSIGNIGDTLNDSSVNTVAELTALSGIDGQVCTLTDKDRGGVFIYDSTAVDNGGTVFGNWVRQYDGPVNVKWFGAKEHTEQSTLFQYIIDLGKDIIFDGDYLISTALTPVSNTVLKFKGKLTASGILSGYEAVLVLWDCENVTIDSPVIDCGLFDANSGIIVRDNTSNITILNPNVSNALWDTTRGGGRGVIIEGNTGTEGRIFISNLKCDNVDTVLGVNGYEGSRKNHIVVTGVLGTNVNKLIGLWGNGGTYPHTGDSSSCVISNVSGYNVQQPIRFDRGGNSIISNVYIYNSPTYGSIDSVVQGTCNNVTIDNFTYEGDCSKFYNATPWNDSGTIVDLGLSIEKCNFTFKHIGETTDFLVNSYSDIYRVKNTYFNISADVITNDVIANAQFRNHDTVYTDFFSLSNQARISGFNNIIGSTVISTYSNVDYKPQAKIGTLDISSVNMIPNVNNQYNIGSASNRIKQLYMFDSIDILHPSGRRYNINIVESAVGVATVEATYIP